MINKKTIIKVILITLILLATLHVFFTPKSIAINFNPGEWAPSSTTEVTGANKLLNMGNVIVGAIRAVGSIISVLVLVVLGIKYMVGSVEERAEYKKTMLPYVIGAIMVCGITNFIAIIIDVTKILN